MSPTAMFPLLAETTVATTRYLAALDPLTDEDCRDPSALPGWTRGHVITHLSRNADGLRNLLIAARTGEDIPMYLSQESRNADIEDGASRSAAQLREEAAESAAEWQEAALALDPMDFDALVHRTPGAEPFPVRGVCGMRRTEVEVHHADLAIGYTADDWPEDFVDYLLASRIRDLASHGTSLTLLFTDTGDQELIGNGGTEVAGPRADVLWWLIGRGTGAGLDPSGALPSLPGWR